MSLWVDIKYAKLVGSRLRNFKIKRTTPFLANYSCNICGDSKTDKTKTRAYFYAKDNELKFTCHNCGAPFPFALVLQTTDEPLYREYMMEKFKEVNDKYRPAVEEIDSSFFTQKTHELLPADEMLNHFQRAKDVPQALDYLKSRQIPEDKWHLFYHTETFKKTSNLIVPDTFDSEKFDHARLIIPFLDETKKMFAFQGRAYGNEIPKYLTVKLDPDAEKIFGLERLDREKRVFVLEGPIDSIFLTNCIAIAGSALDIPFVDELSDKIIIPDNQQRNVTVNKHIERYIDRGFRVCFFPDKIRAKDINDMVKSGMSRDEIERLILNNVYGGLTGKLKFNDWRKVK